VYISYIRLLFSESIPSNDVTHSQVSSSIILFFFYTCIFAL